MPQDLLVTATVMWFVAVIVLVCGHIVAVIAVAVIVYPLAIINIVCGHHRLGSWPSFLCSSLLWPSLSTLWPSLTWFVAVIVLVCGHIVAVIAVAVIVYPLAIINMVCGHHRLGLWPSFLWPSLLWPSLSTLWPSLTWFVAVIFCGRHCKCSLFSYTSNTDR